MKQSYFNLTEVFASARHYYDAAAFVGYGSAEHYESRNIELASDCKK